MGTNWSERALGEDLGGEGSAEYGETVAMYNQFFFMKIGLLLVPIPIIIQTNIRASNQMKMICLYHLGQGTGLHVYLILESRRQAKKVAL